MKDVALSKIFKKGYEDPRGFKKFFLLQIKSSNSGVVQGLPDFPGLDALSTFMSKAHR